jgi:hypothetical protein
MAKSTPKEQLLAHLKKNGKDMSWAELTKKFNPGAHHEWSRNNARISGFVSGQKTFKPAHIIENTKFSQEINTQKKNNKEFVKKIIELEKKVAFLSDFNKHKPSEFVIPTPTDPKKHEGVAVTQWSDWHIDEKIVPSTVNGMNEYNPEIATERANILFANTIKLTNTQRGALDIKRLIIHKGGDDITGWIHPENMQTNTMTPQEAIFFVHDLQLAGIQYLLDHGDFEMIDVVCSRGNHGRTTPKMQYGNDYSTNNENYLNNMLAKHFRNEPRVRFQIDNSETAYMEVYGRILRFFHGWQVRFMGGIGGITVPLYKAIHRWNDTTPAYYNFMGDKHVYSNPTPDSVLNGSLVGYNAYALSHGFKFQRPIQSFTIIDSKYGATIKAPIFCSK